MTFKSKYNLSHVHVCIKEVALPLCNYLAQYDVLRLSVIYQIIISNIVKNFVKFGGTKSMGLRVRSSSV